MIPRERVPVFHDEDAAVDALAELSEGDVHRGLVLDDGRLTGFLSITDLARALDVRMPRGREPRATTAG
jgi:CBS domain-containing protein